MAAMTPLRAAVLGVGAMGRSHARVYAEMENVRLAAIADPDARAAERIAGSYGTAAYADYRELLDREKPDLVTIAVPTTRHAEVALETISRGIHLLVEKPLSFSLDEARSIIDAADSQGVKLAVGHIERFNPAVTKLAELIADGRIGQVFRAHATRVGPLPLRIRDAGVAVDLATHDLDIMQHVLGRDISSVYAEGTRFSHPTQEDIITCLLRFGDGGPFGLLDVNWLTPEKRRELTVIGEGGMITASYITQDVWLTEAAETPTGWEELARVRGDAEGSVVKFALRKVEPLRAELQAFADCILEDTPEPVSAFDGCRALIAALAVRDSATNARPVKLLGMPTAPRPALAVA
jgi:UDP-N-acetylglucosamine 3-dehydrogenase